MLSRELCLTLHFIYLYIIARMSVRLSQIILNTVYCIIIIIFIYLFFPMPPHVLMNFRGFPPGCGGSGADFWSWDAHGAQLRCPDDEWWSAGRWNTRRGLKPKSTNHPDHGHHGGRTGNRTRDLMISSQRPWPLDHEAGLILVYRNTYFPPPSGRRWRLQVLSKCFVYPTALRHFSEAISQ